MRSSGRSPASPRPRATLSRCWSSARRCAARAGSTTRAVVHPSRAASSASCPRPICRTTASSTSGGISARAPASPARQIAIAGAARCRSASISCSARRGSRAVHLPCRDLRGRLGAAAALDARGAGRRGDAAQPVGQQHHHRQGRDPPPALRQPVGARRRGLCLFGRGAGRIDHRPRLGRPCGDLRDMATCWPRPSAFPTDATLATADVDLGRLRQERMRLNTFGDCVARRARRAPPFRIVTSRSTRRTSRCRCARAVERFPFVPADPARLREDCYEAYNIQVQGLAKRLAGDRARARR